MQNYKHVYVKSLFHFTALQKHSLRFLRLSALISFKCTLEFPGRSVDGTWKLAWFSQLSRRKNIFMKLKKLYGKSKCNNSSHFIDKQLINIDYLAYRCGKQVNYSFMRHSNDALSINFYNSVSDSYSTTLSNPSSQKTTDLQNKS